MINIRIIAWSFILTLMLGGCSSPQKKASVEPAIKTEPAVAPRIKPVIAEKKKPVLELKTYKDDAGYQVKPFDIEIREGRPYLPVGAELVTKAGKVPLGEVLKELGELKGFSISWADDVVQDTLVDADVMPADNFWDAINNILRQLDYFYEVYEDTIIINYKESRTYFISQPAVGETFTSNIGSSGTQEGTSAGASLGITANAFNFWDDLETSLGQIIGCEGCTSIIDRNLGMVTVNAPKKVHNDLERYLSSLQSESYKQVVVEAKVIEVQLTDNSEKGIDWEQTMTQAFSGAINFSPSLSDGTPTLYDGNGNLSTSLASITLGSEHTWGAVVAFFDNIGNTKTIANPKVHILNGHAVVLSAVEERQYLYSCGCSTTDSGAIECTPELDTVVEGMILGVKANIMDNDEVVVVITPSLRTLVSLDPTGTTSCGTTYAPHITIREMTTNAKVRDGEMLVIGGLIQSRKQTNSKEVPLLSDIPVVDRLFEYKSEQDTDVELVIILKPTIIPSSGVSYRVTSGG